MKLSPVQMYNKKYLILFT